MNRKPSLWCDPPPPWLASALLGAVCIILLTFQGWACEVFEQMYRDFGVELSGRFHFLTVVRWWWTLPLSIVMAGLLIWKATAIPAPRNKRIDLIVFLVLLVQAVLWIWKAFSVELQTGIVGG